MNALISPKTVGLEGPTFHSTASALVHRDVSVCSVRTSIAPVWNDSLTSILSSLQCAVDESSVFAAVTGPKNSGKSSVVAELLATSKSENRICVDIRTPHQVAAKTAAALYEAIRKAIKQSEHAIHILVVVDNAHTSSEDLLLLLNRFAIARSSASSPQVILVGEPDLWDRLAFPRYGDLVRRTALRCSLESGQCPPPLWGDHEENGAIDNVSLKLKAA